VYILFCTSVKLSMFTKHRQSDIQRRRKDPIFVFQWLARKSSVYHSLSNSRDDITYERPSINTSLLHKHIGYQQFQTYSIPFWYLSKWTINQIFPLWKEIEFFALESCQEVCQITCFAGASLVTSYDWKTFMARFSVQITHIFSRG